MCAGMNNGTAQENPLKKKKFIFFETTKKYGKDEAGRPSSV